MSNFGFPAAQKEYALFAASLQRGAAGAEITANTGELRRRMDG